MGPVQSVVLALVADEPFRVVWLPVGWFLVVFLLGMDKLLASIDRGQFILANSSQQDFFLAGVCIEKPDTVLADEWDWKRPVLCTDIQNHRSVRLFGETMHLLVFHDEADAVIHILGRIARRDYLFSR